MLVEKYLHASGFIIDFRYICPNIGSMTTHNETKLRRLLSSVKPETAVLASWLEELGISRDLQKHYRNSGWLETIDRGAFKRPGENVQWQGALYALQYQANLNVHVGAISALSMQGFSHYFRLSEEKLFLFSPRKTNLPRWFLRQDWGSPISHYQTTFLPIGLGIVEHEEKNFHIQISSPERALFESLYLAPDTIDLVECFHIMEALVNLQPKLVQELLQKCKSIQVKRLFLYLAEKAKHNWFQFIDLSSVDLGSGSRRITAGGVYVSKYQITIPKELAEL